MRMPTAYVLRRGCPIRRHEEDYATNLISGCCGVPNKPTNCTTPYQCPMPLPNASMRPLIDPFAESEILTYYSLSCCLFRVLIIYGPFFCFDGFVLLHVVPVLFFSFRRFYYTRSSFLVSNGGLIIYGDPSVSTMINSAQGFAKINITRFHFHFN